MGEKCNATGKVIFLSNSEARSAMLNIRLTLKNKKRGKHRKGKASQKRIYSCGYCNGFHLTSWAKEYKYTKQPEIINNLIVLKHKEL